MKCNDDFNQTSRNSQKQNGCSSCCLSRARFDKPASCLSRQRQGGSNENDTQRSSSSSSTSTSSTSRSIGTSSTSSTSSRQASSLRAHRAELHDRDPHQHHAMLNRHRHHPQPLRVDTSNLYFIAAAFQAYTLVPSLSWQK